MNVDLLKGENDLQDGRNFYGSFNVEFIEKNFGTFEEDMDLRCMVDCVELTIDDKITDMSKLSKEDQVLITNLVVNIARKEFCSFKVE